MTANIEPRPCGKRSRCANGQVHSRTGTVRKNPGVEASREDYTRLILVGRGGKTVVDTVLDAGAAAAVPALRRKKQRTETSWW
jgi:hypothetical protein